MLTRDYFLHHKWLVLLGAISGIALAALVGLGAHSVVFLFAWMAVMPFVTCPLTLKTRAGRLWWAAYVGLVLCLALVYHIRLPHPLAWVIAVACAWFGVVTVCLRWAAPDTEDGAGTV